MKLKDVVSYNFDINITIELNNIILVAYLLIVLSKSVFSRIKINDRQGALNMTIL